MSSDDMPTGTVLAAILGSFVLMTAVVAAEWWLARRWPLWLFTVVMIAWTIGAELVKRAARQRKANRAKVRAAETAAARWRGRPPADAPGRPCDGPGAAGQGAAGVTPRAQP